MNLLHAAQVADRLFVYLLHKLQIRVWRAWPRVRHDVIIPVCVCVCECPPSPTLSPTHPVRPRLHYRLLTLCPAPTDPVPRGLLTLWAQPCTLYAYLYVYVRECVGVGAYGCAWRVWED